MTQNFPKPWTMDETDPTGTVVIIDANGRKLFYITPDDPGDPDHQTPGDRHGPTVLIHGGSDESDELFALIETWCKQP